MTNDDLTAEMLLTTGATALSTQYLLSGVIRVLMDDGVISRDQIRRAIAIAKSELESVPDPIRVRAALLLEPSEGDV